MEFLNIGDFNGETVSSKIKLDLYNSAIWIIVKGGFVTQRPTELTGEKLQQFASICLRYIAHPRKQFATNAEIEAYCRITNAELRRKHCIPQSTRAAKKENTQHI